jgi:TP901 family phage tail tape measure protein
MPEANLQFKEIVNTANNYALAMGTTTESVMRAIAVFGNYTSTLDQVLEKSKAAIVMSNLTGKDIRQSADDLLGIMTQFKLSADESMKVVDVVSGTARQLQVDYPRGIAEISSGIRNIGSLAVEAKIPMENLSGMIGTLVETTRRSGSENFTLC